MKQGARNQVPYFQASNDVFEMGLGTYELAVYLYLAKCVCSGATSLPSYETIADKCSMSRRKAMQCVAKLEELDLIEGVER